MTPAQRGYRNRRERRDALPPLPATETAAPEVEIPPRHDPWRPKRPLAFERRLRAAKLKAIVFQGGRIAP
jgi:hypothetical protein